MKIKFLLFLALVMSLLSFVSATICSPVSLSWSTGENSTKTLSCIGGNVGNNSINISVIGSYVSISSNTVGSLEQKTISVTFSPPASPSATYFSQVYFSDGYSIPIKMIVTEQAQSGVIIFPTVKVVNIVQGQQKNLNLQVIVPSSYPRPITIQSASFNPDTSIIQFGDLDLGQISPGQTLNIPIKIDSKNAQTGIYSTQISIMATDSQGQIPLSSSNWQVVVSAGVTTGNGTLTEPSCTLSHIELSMNTTATFSCSNVVSNLEVSPQYNEYLQGISADLSATGIYTYTFKPTKIGSTKFNSIFLYNNAPIFSIFSKDIRITPSGGTPVSGTSIKASFFQGGIKKETNELIAGDVTLLALDEKTDSILTSFLLYLNGIPTNNTFLLKSDMKYELRVSSPGYIDKVINISVSKLPLGIIITPGKGTYEISDIINVSTNPENGSILMNNVVVTSPISLLSEGVFTIKAVKEGYESTEKNITVKKSIQIISGLENYNSWAVGTNVALSLSDNAPWNVTYNGSVIASGNDNLIKFKVEKSGRYEITAKGNMLANKTIENKGWFSWLKWSYLWWIIGGIVLIWIVFGLGRNKGDRNSSGFIMSPKISSQEG